MLIRIQFEYEMCIVFAGLNGSPKQNGTPKQSPSPTKSEPFPKDREKANIVQCPTFRPTDEQFKDPLEYIQSISAKAEPYGICKIVPPPSWKVHVGPFCFMPN